MTQSSKRSAILTAAAKLALLALFLVEPAFAVDQSAMESDSMLGEMIVFWSDLVTGAGGYFIAILGLLFLLFEALVRKSLTGALVVIGITLVARFGPSIVAASMGATII